MRREDHVLRRAEVALGRRTTRRSFLGRVGRSFVALAGGGLVAGALAPERAEAFHICGHIYTTKSCPHPYYPLSRTDKWGYPVHPTYGYPVDDHGKLYVSRDQPRRRICKERVPDKYPYTGQPVYGGGWSRCCEGRVRRIQDCCSHSDIRINGDAALHGYCHGTRKVFCITYMDLDLRC
jgi:hypothetical protein